MGILLISFKKKYYFKCLYIIKFYCLKFTRQFSGLLLLIYILLGSFDLSVFRLCLFIYLLVYLFIYLINVWLFDWFYSTNKTGFRILSNTFRSISSPIDNVFCSRCWLAKRFKMLSGCWLVKRFKMLSDKLMLIGQTPSERNTRLIGNLFCHFIG